MSWDLEREIWGHAFKAVLGLSRPGQGGPGGFRDCGLLLTEPLFNFPALRSVTEQV